MKIAILGWGSLLWDPRPEFDNQHEDWQDDGPSLKIEFSRISKSRACALTLVLDPENGEMCRVAYTLSRRTNPCDARCDLRSREATELKYIGLYPSDEAPEPEVDAESLQKIQTWMSEKELDSVIWTALTSNFAEIRKQQFSVKNAISHIQNLCPEGKAKAAEYVWRAPHFIDTHLRRKLQSAPWFPRTD